MANFNWLHDSFDNFIITISNYVRFMRRQRDITVVNHVSETSIHSINQVTTIKIYNQNIWITNVNKAKYYNFGQLLTSLPM